MKINKNLVKFPWIEFMIESFFTIFALGIQNKNKQLWIINNCKNFKSLKELKENSPLTLIYQQNLLQDLENIQKPFQYFNIFKCLINTELKYNIKCSVCGNMRKNDQTSIFFILQSN